MPVGSDQMTHDMQELAGVILVDEQESQSGNPVWPTQRSKCPALPPWLDRVWPRR
jgi:hypothetical protein